MQANRTKSGQIGQEAEKLVALLTLCTGDGFESFSTMTERMQHAALAQAADMAAAIGHDAKAFAQPTIGAPNELELLDEIDQAAGLLASAAQSFADLSAMLEAIAESSSEGSLAKRLAQAGVNVCENRESDFTNYSFEFCRDTEQYSRALGLDEFRRFSSAEQSSPVMEGA